MSSKKLRNAWNVNLIADRSLSLAIVHFTRRTDLKVTSPSSEACFDLLVSIPSEEATESSFGVKLKGIVSKPEFGEIADTFQPEYRNSLATVRSTLPILFCTFVMDTNEGFAAWLIAPTISTGHSQLILQETPEPLALTNARIDTIVEQVQLWYQTSIIHRSQPDEPLALLHRLIDAQATFAVAQGHPPHLLKLPILLAYQLAKLGHDHLGSLSEVLILKGVQALEETGILGMRVQLQQNGSRHFTLE